MNRRTARDAVLEYCRSHFGKTSDEFGRMIADQVSKLLDGERALFIEKRADLREDVLWICFNNDMKLENRIAL